MYRIETIPADSLQNITRILHPGFGVSFDVEQVLQADRLEIWGTLFKDPGPDYCEHRLMRGETVIALKRQNGY